MKVPRAVVSDEAAVGLLTGHGSFVPDVTPVQLLNRATDPMLPVVKPHLFAVLRALDVLGLTNHVLVITRWRVGPEDCAVLNSLRHLKVTVLVTWSGIDDDRVEPVDSGVAETSLKTLFAHARRYRVVHYWRPVVPGLNDSEVHLARGAELGRFAHATVFTGLFFRDEIRDYYRAHGLPEPYGEVARRKIMPEDLEARVLGAVAAGPGDAAAVFRKTSCAVAYAHGLPDYNGHYGVRELCDICPVAQLDRCAGVWRRPDPDVAAGLVEAAGGRLVEVGDRAVVVEGLDEQARYPIQHRLGFQVHDAARPHHRRRHGRADLGWPSAARSAS
ncbi:radical SAM protein [Saccharothrix violaceirubra]|uniref:Radical SAM protein n=1 Tax=Saccharothrix violaceirubra TaxID=413306 RepID=A0A7W7T4H3_9PSEU|nr:radical SAM protein [Saccharothrix violaceirubra]MBB4966366.1 hypothetical protein [Saccharothrix violaceirubra]